MRLFAESDKLNKASLEHVRETNAWLEIHTEKTDEWSFFFFCLAPKGRERLSQREREREKMGKMEILQINGGEYATRT